MENPIIQKVNFTSFKPDSDETRIMHTKSDNPEIMISSDTNEVIKKSLNHFSRDIKKVYKKK